MKELIQCEFCDKKFCKYGIHPHVKSAHKGIKPKGCQGQTWKAKTSECKICKKQISVSNIKKHENSCKGQKKTYSIEQYRILDTNSFLCPHCQKEFKKHSIGYHVWRHNEGKNHDPFADVRRRPIWNKNQTKETHSSVKKGVEKRKEGNYSSWCKGKTKSSDPRLVKLSQRIGETIKRKIEQDEWHFYTTISKPSEYKGIKFDSGWEIKFAVWLDSLLVEWIRTKDSFQYEWNGSTHRYFPDFYIPSLNVYVEIKGLITERDECKWKVVNNLVVLTGNELREMKII